MANTPEGHLTEAETLKLFHELEEDDSGVVTYDNVRAKIESLLPGSAPSGNRFTRRFSRSDTETATTNPNARCILNEYYPKHRQPLSQDQFVELVKTWNVPSQSSGTSPTNASDAVQHPASALRRFTAFVSLEARQILFMTFVVTLQLAFGIWEMVLFLNNQPARHAFGWGVVVAKTFAGPIYPTIFLMLLSMSRWTATLCRKVPGLGRVVNWDLHRGFHIYMCSSCLVFATIHAIAHMSGDFVWATRPDHQAAVQAFWGLKYHEKRYTSYLELLPGWSGIAALIIFWLIFALSMPIVRRSLFELFQLGHLLFYPLIGLLAAHGTLALLQKPMLGYFLALPSVIVVIERVHRLVRGCLHMPGTIKILDKDTVTLTIQRRWDGPWRCSAGQYILLQVPAISVWQWHPFTISSCNADKITVHTRYAGDWTKDLRRLPKDESFCVSVDGPFGAPAQQVYQFERAIVVGSGIGVTPMSSIANDFANKVSRNKDPWRKLDRFHTDCSPFARVYSPFTSRGLKNSNSSSSLLGKSKLEEDGRGFDSLDLEKGAWVSKEEQALSTSVQELLSPRRRRVDFHWITRDPPSLQWFSDYLNRAQEAAEAHSQNASAAPSSASSFVDPQSSPCFGSSRSPSRPPSRTKPPTHLQFKINTYVTAANKSVSDHVFKHLVDRYRGPGQDYSILTGLKNRSHFRRPDFSATLQEYHQQMREQGWSGGEVGVFYCGNPALGATLKEACRTQTTLAWADGSKIGYRFITEVF